MKKRTKPAAKKPAAKKPAARKRRNAAKYPSGTALVIAAPQAAKRRRRKNPAFNVKKALEGLFGLAPGAVVGVGGELGLLTARGEAVAGAVMIAGGLAMIGTDTMPALGGAMVGAGAVPVAREAYRMITAQSAPPAGLVPPAPVAGIGSDYAPRAGEVVMDQIGRAMIADGRGGFLGRASVPVQPAYAVQGAGAISNV